LPVWRDRLRSGYWKWYLAEEEYLMMSIAFFIVLLPLCDDLAEIVNDDAVEADRQYGYDHIVPFHF
jgi:hypothetical protein